MVDEVGVGDVDRVRVQRQDRNRAERDTRTVHVGNVEGRVANFHEQKVRRVGSGEGRGIELGSLLVDGADAEPIVRSPLHAAGECDAMLVLLLERSIRAQRARGLERDAVEREIGSQPERER